MIAWPLNKNHSLLTYCKYSVKADHHGLTDILRIVGFCIHNHNPVSDPNPDSDPDPNPDSNPNLHVQIKVHQI